MITRHKRPALVAALLAVLAAGCGTTVSGSVAADSNGSNGNTSLGLGAPTAVATNGATALPGSAGAGNAANGGPTTVTGNNGSTGNFGNGSTGSAGGAPIPAVGITNTTIYVGVTYSSGDDTANKALGNNITTGDQKADAQAVIDDINAHGGVLHRKLVPVWYDYQETDARPYGTIDDEACATFTQDNHVFAVAGEGITDEFESCILKRAAFILAGASGLIGPDEAFFKRFPDYFTIGYVSQDRMMANEVPSLVRQHYFSGWNNINGTASPATPVKVGILSFDTPKWHIPLTHVLLPKLKQAGYTVATNDIQEVTYPSSEGQVGNSTAGIQAAVLRFRQDNVSHVIVLDQNGSMTLYMLQNMRAQRYYPRLGINSATGAEALYTNYAQDAQSFNGAVGLGWIPTEDLPAGASGKYLTSHTTACIKMIEKRTGQKFSDPNAASIALGYCDKLYLVADAINMTAARTSTIDRATVTATLNALQGRFTPSGSAGLYFSPAQHDGIEYGYDLEFDSKCLCSKYVSGPFVMS